MCISLVTYQAGDSIYTADGDQEMTSDTQIKEYEMGWACGTDANAHSFG
jgi:hypothetical protein